MLKRIILILIAALIMAAIVAVSALPAMAQSSNSYCLRSVDGCIERHLMAGQNSCDVSGGNSLAPACRVYPLS